jgi:hypothetical protein
MINWRKINAGIEKEDLRDWDVCNDKVRIYMLST